MSEWLYTVMFECMYLKNAQQCLGKKRDQCHTFHSHTNTSVLFRPERQEVSAKGHARCRVVSDTGCGEGACRVVRYQSCIQGL